MTRRHNPLKFTGVDESGLRASLASVTKALRTRPVIFTASQFTPTQWDTAEAKAAFANALAEFVLSGFDAKKYTVDLYRNLQRCFGHIAHYDKDGFWSTWFESSVARNRWFAHTLSCPPSMGSPLFTFSDVEDAFKRWLTATGLHEKCAKEVKREEEEKELVQLRALMTKYPNEVRLWFKK